MCIGESSVEGLEMHAISHLGHNNYYKQLNPLRCPRAGESDDALVVKECVAVTLYATYFIEEKKSSSLSLCRASQFIQLLIMSKTAY